MAVASVGRLEAAAAQTVVREAVSAAAAELAETVVLVVATAAVLPEAEEGQEVTAAD